MVHNLKTISKTMVQNGKTISRTMVQNWKDGVKLGNYFEDKNQKLKLN